MKCEMQYVPWRNVSDWRCRGCGDCCRLYSVVINVSEWLQIAKNFGVEQTVSGLDKLFIKRADDGSCAFLCNLAGTYCCGLQHMKPKACQLWPFKILNIPKYGLTNEAAYPFGEGKLFIYVDSMCNGVTYGNPIWEFANQTLKEFIEIAMGMRNVQARTTGRTRVYAPRLSFGELKARKLF